MKTILVSFLIFLSLNFAFSQAYIHIDQASTLAIYNYNFRPDSTSTTKIKSVEMTLFIGKEKSVFASYAQLYTDSLLRAYKDFDESVAFTKIWPMISGLKTDANFCSYYIYKNYPLKGKTTMTSELSKQFYKLESPSTFQWELVANEQKTILGYKCSKATTSFGNRKYEAWFTTAIPISDGPYKFTGLPGLILEIYDTQRHHHFEIISIQNINYAYPMFFIENQYTTVTQDQYKKAWDRSIVGKYEKYQNMTLTEEKKAQVLNRYKNTNNPIER